MENFEIRNYILKIISDICPETDTSFLDDQESFRDQLDLDSMDFLDLVMELRKRHRVEIPKEDFQKIVTMENFVNYLSPQFTKFAA